jgi:Protein of unknown function (DUF2889)
MKLRDAALETTPTRRAGSLRRTTSHACIRADGLEGPVTAVCRGRDLFTATGGATATLAEHRIEVEVVFAEGTITSIDADPPLPGGLRLVGRGAYSGFRRHAGDVFPHDKATHTVRFQLLDDLPIALLLSGRVVRAEGIALGRSDRPPPTDICAGWVAGGFAVKGFTELGPPLTIGPRAPMVERSDDATAWHRFEPSSALSTHRRRRLDVWIEDGAGQVDTYLRDSYVDREGTETTVHEYGVRASIDVGTGRFTEVVAVPGRLPFPECLTAAGSAGRLAGAPTIGLRDWVAASLTGPSTCTHLNDTLRSLEGVGPLLLDLEGQLSSRPPAPDLAT